MSPVVAGILTQTGLIDAPYTATSLAEAAEKEPQGIYTLARTFERHKALLLDEHLDRLEESAVLEGIPLKLDRPALRAALRILLDRAGFPDSRFRMTIPRQQPDQIWLALEPFKPVPPEIVQQGAKVVTLHKSRHNPSAKTTDWMAERKEAVKRFPSGTYEGILLAEDSSLLEGTSCNFYVILNGVLRTAGDAWVLSGMGRRILLQVAPSIVPVQMEPVCQQDIPALTEAMLTSSGRGVVPIVEIDGTKIGSGSPGPITRRLAAAYNEWATAHLEEI